MATACAVLIGIENPNPSATVPFPVLRTINVVDADHFTREINQRSARVALIDGRVGLDQTFDLVSVTGVDGTSGRADHAHGHRVLEVSKRRADGDRGLTGFEQI